MFLKKAEAGFFVPDGSVVEVALKRTTHLAIAAHQDDIEIMAGDGILKCFGQSDQWFTGVVVTNGSGSPRDGRYASYSDEEMKRVRTQEQKKAALVGEYSAQVFMQYESQEVKDKDNQELVIALRDLFMATEPNILYTHNLADKHDTHVATASQVIKALRMLEKDRLPQKVYGCEVWRDLDWVPDSKKVIFDLSGHESISASLLGVFDSQLCGGKRYDLAVLGRRRAHATFCDAHQVDSATALSYAIDLTPLIRDPFLSIKDYIKAYIESFQQDVEQRMERLGL